MKGGETVSKQGNRNFPHLTLATYNSTDSACLIFSACQLVCISPFIQCPIQLFFFLLTPQCFSSQTVTYKGAVYTALTLNIQPGLLRPDFAPSKQPGLQPCNSPYFTDVCIHYYRTQASYLKCIMLTFI